MVYLKLFHGRDTLTEELEDWGYDGPVIGPVPYVHTTYASDVKFHLDGLDHMLPIIEGLVKHEGKFYGDFSITSDKP